MSKVLSPAIIIRYWVMMPGYCSLKNRTARSLRGSSPPTCSRISRSTTRYPMSLARMSAISMTPHPMGREKQIVGGISGLMGLGFFPAFCCSQSRIYPPIIWSISVPLRRCCRTKAHCTWPSWDLFAVMMISLSHTYQDVMTAPQSGPTMFIISANRWVKFNTPMTLPLRVTSSSRTCSLNME